MGRLEARTEDMFKDLCIKQGYTAENGIIVDRQTCSLAEINTLFAHASKNESGRPGYPDFIITNKIYPGIVMLVECKADNANHNQAESEVIYYAGFIKGRYDVVIVAVSGTTNTDFKITTAIIRKDGSVVNEKTEGYNSKALLPLDDYEKHIGYTKRAERAVLDALDEIKDDINWVLYEMGDLQADKRMLIVSAAILALRDAGFRNSYCHYMDDDLLEYVIQAVDRSLKNYGIADTKRKTMVDYFYTLKQIDSLVSGVTFRDGGETNPLRYIIDKIHYSAIHSAFENSNTSLDIMGAFFSEFITHKKGGDSAKNSFVLTPGHICELFAELGELDENTKVLDMCFGTGGFLVAAMEKEVREAKGDAQKIKQIKHNNLCGVELNGDRFTYGCVNMILRGDGQSNMVKGDCFNAQIQQEMKDKHCTVGLLNPPYALPTNEMKFVESMLDCLEVGGRGIAIVPSSCTGNKNSDYATTRERILSKHTLEAVLSMPDQLFYPASSVVTCVMIFTAHKPHNSDRKTWFANCKDDGLIIDRKSKGRADINGKWADTKKKWVDAFINRDEIKGFSLKQAVTAKDEWSYEAYAKTDFNGITEESFKKVIKDYALFILGQTEI